MSKPTGAIQTLIYATLAIAVGSLFYGLWTLALILGAIGGVLWWANRKDEQNR